MFAIESPLACSPCKAEPFLHLQLTYRNLYALQTKTITKQSALISLESSKCSIVAHTQLSATAFGGFISSLPSPTQPTYHKTQAGREGTSETSLRNHLFISGSWMWCGTSLEKKSSLPAAHHASQGCLQKHHQTSADTSNYIQIADTRSVIDLFLEGRTSYPVKRGVTLLNSERIITQHRGHSCYWYTSGFVSKPDREQRSSERFSIQRQA